MANTKKPASADVKEAAVKTEAAAVKEAAKTAEKKPAAKRGRKPAAAKTENKPAAKTAAKKPAAKTEKNSAAKTAKKPAAKSAAKTAKKPAEKAAPAKRGGGKKKVVSYEEIVTAARSKLRAADITKITRPIAANVEITGNFSENQTPDDNGSNKNIFYIAINPDEQSISVEPYRYNDNDISIYADADELLNVMKGKKNIYAALADGNIHIHGNTKKAILLIHAGF